MKMTPEFQKAQANMQPGIITADGFLGNDERNLVDIIMEDEEILISLNCTIEKIIKKMLYLKKAGEKGLGEPITVDGKWEVQVGEARGHLPCPFEDGIFRKVVTKVTNLENNESIIFSDLSIHLIEKHLFFQGKGSPFRLDPLKLIKVLDICK
ncbi:hypothetical protein SAMN02745164_01379 [Marinitoga hydrogenitolerans DSM 16785]|uniref:Uncharacterized protein n=1 Tax=Marinitoga hydrogenitolerans (strain DSM 16785 / JCM 12826 / AT1271) TaxID=1122195 RepID=A0A1M4XA54_MARH1|nr:hypothetical protein [Marinitoga hydrogenitolerans]SHE90369.1 hypothetical protein SAMN02745164_01379 [Marinitoga hydrogenitolerans DSM 16785]